MRRIISPRSLWSHNHAVQFAGQNVYAAACGLSEQSLNLLITCLKTFIYMFSFASNLCLCFTSTPCTQKSRLKSLESLRKAKSRSIVVASDVAARGIDIDSVSTVIHYDCARAVDTFIHRAGRTAVGRFLRFNVVFSCQFK